MPVLPEYSLTGKVAMLATAGGDQAPYLAQALDEAGASVFAVARRTELLDQVLEALDSSRSHDGVVADAATPAGITQVMEAFDRRHNQIDILVNDARSMFARPFGETTAEEWNTIHSRNVVATFQMCQEAGRRMIQREYGRIVNVISGLAERGMINGSAFAASQAAVLSLTRCLSVEWGEHNIRVNALGTGWFTVEDIPLEQQQQELLVRYTPLRRKGHPRDICPLLVYLCTEACDYNTGQAVYVDGGLNAHP